MCVECSDSYHLLCLIPPLSRAPRGAWVCHDCKSAGNKGKMSNSKKKAKAPSKRLIVSDDEEEDEEDTGRSDADDVEDSRNGVDSGKSIQIYFFLGLTKFIFKVLIIFGIFLEDDRPTDNDEDEDSEEESSDATEVVKVRFGKRNSGNSAKNKRSYEDDDDYIDSEEDRRHSSGRGSKRKCATQAAVKISQVAKRLRSDSKENESSGGAGGGGGDGLGDSGYDGADAPKRTRLQRMNTNNRVRNGELDNVLLDKVLSEVMKNKEASPFLKPVTRNEVDCLIKIKF